MTVFSLDDTKVLYVHVPKTGGTSVEFAFRDGGWTLSYWESRHEENAYRTCPPQHMHASLIHDTLRVSRFRGVFMTVREPIARFQSEYLTRHERRPDLRIDEEYVEDWAFRQFARTRRDPFHFDNHLRPQNEFLLPGAHVYKLEDGVDEMLRDVNRRFGIAGPTTAAREKVGGQHRQVSSRDVQISDRLREELSVRYAADFKAFGYAA